MVLGYGPSHGVYGVQQKYDDVGYNYNSGSCR